MKLTDGEKLILSMLCEIHEALDIKDGVEPKFVKSALQSGNLWGLEWRYPGIFEVEDKEDAAVTDVCNILDMWFMLETSYAGKSDADKAQIASSDVPFKSVQFRGFDGNNETELIVIADFLIDDLERFTHFKGRDMNSHMPVIDAYRRMYRVFEPMRTKLDGRNLSVGEITAILQAAAHPDSR